MPRSIRIVVGRPPFFFYFAKIKRLTINKIHQPTNDNELNLKTTRHNRNEHNQKKKKKTHKMTNDKIKENPTKKREKKTMNELADKPNN